MMTVKIRELRPPSLPLSEFDPGAYLAGMDFYETDEAITDEERDGLAQLVHFVAFIALQAKSTCWSTSSIAKGTTVYRALESYFGHLSEWEHIAGSSSEVPYQRLVSSLMRPFPPHLPKQTPEI